MPHNTSFVLRTPYFRVITRDLKMTDEDLVRPPGAVVGSTPILAGEWLTYDADYKGVRGSTQNVTLGNLATDPIAFKCWPAYYDQGMTDVQVLKRVPVLFIYPGVEVDTTVYEDGGAFTMSGAVMATQVTDPDGATRCGLAPVSGTHLVVGYVTRLPAANDGKLRVFLV